MLVKFLMSFYEISRKYYYLLDNCQLSITYMSEMGIITERKSRGYSGLAADRASIPAVGLNVGDKYFSTDTFILSVWDGAAWRDIGVKDLITWFANPGQWAIGPVGGATWFDLDLSGAPYNVPAGAKYVILLMEVYANTAAYATIGVRKNGETPTYYPFQYSYFGGHGYGAEWGQQFCICACDTGRIIEVQTTVSGGTASYFQISVLGYISQG